MRAVDLYLALDKNFHWMVLAGFLAQMVDGAMGMGYGVTSSRYYCRPALIPLLSAAAFILLKCLPVELQDIVIINLAM